jgi:hypothetical protein
MIKPDVYPHHWTGWIPETRQDVEHAFDCLEGSAMAGARPAPAEAYKRVVEAWWMLGPPCNSSNNRCFRDIMDGNWPPGSLTS